MQPSIHQIKVTDWLQNDADCSDAVVNSVAGSGKSTLLKLAAQTISSTNIGIQDCLVLVFNRKNKDALVKKLDRKWRGSISTVHSAGYKTLKSYLSARKFTVDGFKYRNLAKRLDWFDGSNPQQAKVVSLGSFIKLADFVRQTLSDSTTEDLSWLINHYALDINSKYLSEIGERLNYLFQMGFDQAGNEHVIDHTDMLWLPVVWRINAQPGARLLKRLMVDEAQDMSRLQLEFVLTLVHREGKTLFVGDPAQSINGFCGADTESFANIQTRLQAREFTLPICYRCPISHIQLINKLYDHIPIVPRDDAPLGTIEVVREYDLWDKSLNCCIRPGDLVIARCSSSLIDLYLKMIVRGIPSNLVGSSLKQDLVEVLEDVGAQDGFEYQKFEEFCQSHFQAKTVIYQKNDNGSILLLQLQDRIKAIKSLYKHFRDFNFNSIEELARNIEQLFSSEDDRAVCLSTVHRAKGMENERVYIADPLTLPLLWENQKPWQERQEQNLLYVALSRSTNSLFLIGDAFWYDQKTNSIVDSDRKYESDLTAEGGHRQAPPCKGGEAVTSVGASSVTEMVKLASLEELEQYVKIIRSEQGK
ncbi:MAG: UvrD-helicase domain-containing protein, partial [Waterburya sp.]